MTTVTLQKGLTFTVETRRLREALSDMAAIYRQKSSDEILNNIIVSIHETPAHGQTLTMRATDHYHEMVRHVPIRTNSHYGTYLLDYKRFRTLLSGQRGEIELCCVSAATGGDASKYPWEQREIYIDGERADMKGGAVAAVKRAAYAVPTVSKIGRKMMEGVYLDTSLQTIVATDGSRLHVEAVRPFIGGGRSAIIPAMEVSGLLLRRLPEHDANVWVDANSIRFEWSGWGSYQTRLIRKSYVPYNRMDPTGDSYLADHTWIDINEAFVRIIEQVCSMARDFKVERVKITTNKTKSDTKDTFIRAIDKDGSTVFERHLSAVLFNPIEQGTSRSIEFYPKFLLQSIEAGASTLFIKGELDEAILTSQTARIVLMPLRAK